MVKAIIFDLDNTLINFMEMKRLAVEAAVKAMIDAGLKMSKEKMTERIYNIYGKEGIEDQRVFDKALLEEFGTIDYKILAAGIVGYRKAKEGNLSLYPHVHLTLANLIKIGIKMVIVSDAPRLPVWMRLVSLDIEHYFDYVVTFDDVGERKPSPKPFQMALDYLKMLPDEVLMVGDWPERDVVGAKQLGIKTVFARYGDEFGTKDSGADYEVNDIAELLDIVKRENQGQLGLFDKG